MFLTGYQNKKGQEVRTPTKIGKKYMFSWDFVIDVLSLSGAGTDTWAKNFAILKITRVRRVGVYIQKLNIPAKLKAVLNLLKLLLYIALFVHI